MGKRYAVSYPTDELSEREKETLALYSDVSSLGKVAKLQGVTPGTVKRRWQIIKDKMGVSADNETYRERQ
jgi:DNA-binding CsgD family transcriptional regulator